MSIFEDFIEYCKEDNPKLAEDIKTWLADYFDLPNRHIKLSKNEKKWIKENLSVANQHDILGYSLTQFKFLFKDKDRI